MTDKHSLPHRLRRALQHYLVNPITDVLEKTGIHPHAITLSGLVISIGGAILLVYGYVIIAGVVVAIGAITDAFDGSLARKRGIASEMGAMLDAMVDRLQEGAVLLGLLLYFLFTADGAPHEVGLILTFIALFGSFLISYLRARAEGFNITGTSGLVTRTERVVIVVFFLLINQPVILAWVLAIAVLVGAGLRSFSVFRRIWREEHKEG